MDIVYSAAHRQHRGEFEMHRGERQPCFEKPERADMVLEVLSRRGVGALWAPDTFGLAPIERVHAADYLRFLEGAWDEWHALGRADDAMPSVWPMHGLDAAPPASFAGRLGWYAFDSGTPLMAGSWAAARLGVDVTLTARERVAAGARAAFALVRPPGHHAGTDFMGGYCFLNNAAVAAQAWLDAGARRVAILDVDYHHGNGTQQIFYERDDVLFASLHGDPRTEYPFYLGHAAETGRGAGAGFNLNLPLPAGTEAPAWFAALETACTRLVDHAPDALIVSLGVDTYIGDPISRFRLDTPDYARLGARLAALGLPTLFVMEGGYAVAAIGENVAGVLMGFDEAAA
jgi:acetoin utilization deacetylase AcuC-like enzyme